MPGVGGEITMTHARPCFALLAGIILCAALAGCGGKDDRLRAFLLEPRSPVSGTEYRVLPPDMLSITSQYVPDIHNVSQQVRPDGKINLPLLGEVYVADRTPKEIEEVLKKMAKDYYERVDAVVNVTAYRSQKIYVFGQVSRPGPVPWTGTDTLLDILAQVQPTQLSWPEKIKVVRGKPPMQGGYLKEKHKKEPPPPAAEDIGTAVPTAVAKPQKDPSPEEVAAAAAAAGPKEGGEGTVMVINLMAMVQKGDLSHNVLLKPNDVIYVPPNPLAAIGLAIQQLLFPIRPAAESVYLPAQAAAITAIP